MTLKRSVSSSCIHTTTSKRNCKGLNILIVDDNPINIVILKKGLDKLFTRKKPHITEACNGIEVLELLTKNTFDIILLDIDMPLLNGIDTTKCIRNKGQMIPIIAVTSNDSIESRDNYIKIGIVSCFATRDISINLLSFFLE